MAADVPRLLETNERLIAEKSVWNTQWQLVSEYVCQRKMNFTSSASDGAFLNSELWSDVAPKALDTAVSAVIGLVWPDSFSFKLEALGKDLKDDEEIKDWFEEVTEVLQMAMDDPEAGLAMAINEAMTDFFTFMPAIHVEEGTDTDFKFEAWNVSQFAVEEGSQGFIDTFFRQYEWTVRQTVEKFGEKLVSKKVRELYQAKKFTEKVKLLHVIAPRVVAANGGKGNQNMPYSSVHIEIETKHLILESGFHELPTFAFRWSKKIGEKYARTPAMRALPTIMELNALWEMTTLGIEQSYDPALAVYDDGTFGAGTIDRSAGAVNVLNVTGKIAASRRPIERLFEAAPISDVAPLIERLENTVNDHFMIDRLLDTNNETQMTAREALMRNSLRQSTLRSPHSRLIAELFNRMIERCFNIMLRKGRFGYAAGSPEATAWQAMNPNEEVKTIPDKIVQMQGKKKRVYFIRYLTPAARESQAEEGQGLLNLFQFAVESAAVDPRPLKMINAGRLTKRLGEIWAIPSEAFNTEEEMAVNEQAEQQAAEAQNALAKADAMATIGKNAAQADALSRK